jgi:hypothetical protein
MRYFLCFAIFASLVTSKVSQAGPIDEFNSSFSKIVSQYWHASVKINGIATTVFDFKGISIELKQRDSKFEKAIESLKKVNAQNLNGNKEKAFWINVYNFGAMKLVAENYPVDSIRSMKISLLKHPWSIDAIQVGKNKYSLTEIEKDILLKKFNDPRVVFAVSCAAVSCPDRTNQIFHADKLSEEMNQMISQFFKNTQKGMKINKEKKQIKLAWILKKDGHLFKKDQSESEVLDFVAKFVDEDLGKWIQGNKNKLKISYFDHDWSLNDLALKDKED